MAVALTSHRRLLQSVPNVSRFGRRSSEFHSALLERPKSTRVGRSGAHTPKRMGSVNVLDKSRCQWLPRASSSSSVSSQGDTGRQTPDETKKDTLRRLEMASVRTVGSEAYEENLSRMEDAVRVILKGIGEDLDREGLHRTPRRFAKALLDLTKGYNQDAEELVGAALFHDDYNEMVIIRDIQVHSMCEHHMLPFIGKAHIAYIPQGRVLGLSKVARIVRMFCNRLQIQERLTRQIATTLENIVEPSGVAVIMEASHMCMVMRGVQEQHAETVTTCMRGVFEKDAHLRAKFLRLVGAQRVEHTSDEATIHLAKEDIKFAAGHFTIFSQTERERLHGHNHYVECWITGRVGENGMIADYTLFKAHLRKLCAEWDERTLLPLRSPYLTVEKDDEHVRVTHNKETMTFLRKEVMLLPIPNTTLEAMGRYMLDNLSTQMRQLIHTSGVRHIKLGISSGAGQIATVETDFRLDPLEPPRGPQ